MSKRVRSISIALRDGAPAFERKPQSPEMRSFLVACRTAKKNAKHRNVTYELTRADVEFLWERCGGLCEVSGIKFDVVPMEGEHSRRPFAPSLDRIDSAGDYTPDNVRVVCVAVNLAMNHWGESVLYALMFAMVENGKMRNAATYARSSICAKAAPAMPIDVRRQHNQKSVRYYARVRPHTRHPGIALGSFRTVEDALAARVAWGRENRCARVLEQVLLYTHDKELALELAALNG